jgi:hypothetical protein
VFDKFDTKLVFRRRTDRSSSRKRNNVPRKPFIKNTGHSNHANTGMHCFFCDMTNHKTETYRMTQDDDGDIKAIINVTNDYKIY